MNTSTSEPSARNMEANSSPMYPPPMTTSFLGICAGQCHMFPLMCSARNSAAWVVHPAASSAVQTRRQVLGYSDAAAAVAAAGATSGPRAGDCQRGAATLGRTRMSSEVMECSAPSMGALNARPPTAIRMFFAYACRRL